jgi:hypothetical protein
MSIDRSSDWVKIFPESCTELTQRVIRLMPTVMQAHCIDFIPSDGEADGTLYPHGAPATLPATLYHSTVEEFMAQPPYSFMVDDHGIIALVHYEGEPYIKPHGQLTVTVELRNPQYDAQWLEVKAHIPAGWTADYQRSVCFLHPSSCSTGPRGLGHVTGRTTWQITFTAGEDVDAVVETKRGHNLGRVLWEGTAAPNTGIPGIIGGFGKERVIHCPAKGILRNVKHITDTVSKGEIIAVVETENGTVPVKATLDGILRGLIRDGYPVNVGFKMADIDPRAEEYNNCFTISDKARCIAGGVLEAILQRKGELGI